MSNSKTTSTMETKNNTTPPDSPSPSGPALQLGISTSLPLHPDFLTKPVPFARKYGVSLHGDPVASTTRATDLETKEEILRHKVNIHLVAFGAIRLFARIDGPGYRMTVKTIDVNVALLLYGNSDHPIAHDDVARALTRVQREVAPLLADGNDAKHIVPGLAKRGDERASWRYIVSTVTCMHTQLHECYNIAHPGTGAAEGTTPKRTQLGKKGDDLIITIESPKMRLHGEGDGTIEEIPRIKVTVSLKGRGMLRRYRDSGGTARIGESLRLTRFSSSTPTDVHEAITEELEGVHIAPTARSPQGRALTPAKAVAFLSAITSLSVEDLSSAYEGIANSSESTRKRLKRDVSKELARISPVPLSSRLTPAFQAPYSAKLALWPVQEADPRIAAIYA